LGGGHISNTNPLVSDAIPGSTDTTHLYTHFIARGNYGIPAGILKGHLEVLRQGLASMAPSAASAGLLLSNKVECTLEAIVAFAVALGGSTKQEMAVSTKLNRLILLTSRTVSCRGALPMKAAATSNAGAASSVDDQGAVLGMYSTLGSWAYSKGSTVDLLNASLRGSNLDQLEALASPSGGVLVVGNDYAELHVRMSFEKMLGRCVCIPSSSSGYEILHSTMPTLEIRTCSRIVVDRIVGPIVSAADVLLHNNANRTNSQQSAKEDGGDGKLSFLEAELALDDAHLTHSVYYQEEQGSDNNESRVSGKSTSRSGGAGGGTFDALFGSQKSDSPHSQQYVDLVRRNQQRVVLSGINLRYPAATAQTQASVTVQFKVSSESPPVGTISPYETGNVLIGQVTRDSSMDGPSVAAGQCAYVQVVVRFLIRRVPPGE
jgi:hypothetical protein